MVAEKFLTGYQTSHQEDQIDTIDLFNYDHARIDKDVIDGWGALAQGTAFGDLAPLQQEKISKISQACDNFISYDKYVFVTPMWNLGFPAELKMYIDSVCVAGKTFGYTAKGAVGLLKNKKCMHIHATGGFHYGKEEDHSIPYLKSIMNFMGVEDFDHILIEGADALPDKAQGIVDDAMKQAEEKALSL